VKGAEGAEKDERVRPYPVSGSWPGHPSPGWRGVGGRCSRAFCCNITLRIGLKSLFLSHKSGERGGDGKSPKSVGRKGIEIRLLSLFVFRLFSSLSRALCKQMGLLPVSQPFQLRKNIARSSAFLSHCVVVWLSLCLCILLRQLNINLLPVTDPLAADNTALIPPPLATPGSLRVMTGRSGPGCCIPLMGGQLGVPAVS